MKIGRVIGRVTFNHKEEAFKGGRFFLVLACDRDYLLRNEMTPLPKGNSTIVYDRLGADVGDYIAYSEGGEASAGFVSSVGCDAYNCMILDKISYTPPGT